MEPAALVGAHLLGERFVGPRCVLQQVQQQAVCFLGARRWLCGQQPLAHPADGLQPAAREVSFERLARPPVVRYVAVARAPAVQQRVGVAEERAVFGGVDHWVTTAQM